AVEGSPTLRTPPSAPPPPFARLLDPGVIPTWAVEGSPTLRTPPSAPPPPFARLLDPGVIPTWAVEGGPTTAGGSPTTEGDAASWLTRLAAVAAHLL
ncbi:hypothetical protein AB0J56_26475, partial [Actinoplanes xinjiangensis]